MKILKVFFVFFLLATVCLSSKLFAGSDSFQISPAPVPYPKYGADEKMNRYNANYVEMTGSGLEISGAGFNIINRQVMKEEKGAVGVGGGMNFMSGDLNFSGATGDLFVMAWNIQVNLEKQLVKKDKYSLIGFAGLNFPMFFSSFSMSTGSLYIETDSFGFMYGIPFGVQGGIHVHEKWTLAPFFMVNWILGGTVTTTSTTTVAGFTTSSSSDDSIDGYMGLGYGMDIVYEPWNVGLGALIQAADGGGDSGTIDSKVFNISWKQKF